MPSSQFEFFGFAHIAAMGVILAVPTILTLVIKRVDSARATQAICYGFAGKVVIEMNYNNRTNWVV